MEKIILGIDPGIADTGYGFIKVNGNRLECLEYGSIKTPAGQEMSLRLQTLYKDVSTALIVGQARGVAILAISQAGVPILDFTPGQVKQAVSAYGQASKLQVQKMVKLILKLKEIPQPDDAADALAVAICGANQRQY